MSSGEACESLLEALNAQRTDILKSLLDHLVSGQAEGVTVAEVLANQCCEAGSLLHKAVELGQRDAVRALLLVGADPGLKNSCGETPIQMAGPQICQTFSDELLRAVAGSDVQRVQQLLDSGLGTDCVDSEQTSNTTLHWAASFSNRAMVKLLVSRGAEVNQTNAEGCTALHDAVARGDEQVAMALLEAGASHDIIATSGRQKGQSPRSVAEKKGKLSHLFTVITNGNGVHIPEEEEDISIIKEEPLEVTSTTVTEVSLPPLSDPLLTRLWPVPRHLVQLPGQEKVEVAACLQLVISSQLPTHLSIHHIVDALSSHRQSLQAAGHSLTISSACQAGPGHLEVSVSTALGKEEYSLAVTTPQLRIIAGGLSGLHYAFYTLVQLLKIYDKHWLPAIVIRDWPALPVRAVLLDLAHYGRLPSMDTITSTLLSLASVKLNQVHLYTRLTKQTTWQLPYSEGELIALDRHCHDRAISLQPAVDIPQPCNASDLHQFSPAFSRLLACFSSLPSVHLGPSLSSVLLSSTSLLVSVHSLLTVPSATTVYLCANSLPLGPLPLLPSSVGLVEYGFQANHPWLSTLISRASTALPTLLCPGTAAWSCLLGRPSTMEANIKESAAAALATGARGLVVAHWAGTPALAPLASALPGWVLAAGLSWGPQSKPEDLAEALTLHVLEDTMGRAGRVLLELGRAEASLSLPSPEPSLQPSLLLSLVMRPSAANFLEGLDAEKISRIVGEIRRSLATLAVSREGGGGEGEGLLQEVALSGELLLLAARLARALVLTSEKTLSQLQPTFKTDLANKLLSLTEQYRAVWLSRYQPGGMQTSLLHLTSLLSILQPDIHAFTI